MRNPFRIVKGLIDQLFAQQNVSQQASIVMLEPGDPVSNASNYEELVKQGYAGNVYSFASIGLVDKAVSAVPWKLFQKKTGGDRVELFDHPLLKLINRPNPQMGRSQFFEWLTGYYEISGNAYIYINRPREDEPPTELYLLRPDLIEIIAGTVINPVQKYLYGNSPNITKYDPEDIIQFKVFNPIDDFYGQSPAEVSAKSLDQNNGSKNWNLALLQNKCKPSGAVSAKSNLSEPQFNRLKESIKKNYGGENNVGNPMLLEGDMSWIPFSMSPSEMDWSGSAKMSAKEIGIAQNVPPELIGDSENKTYSNYGEARKALYEEKAIPLLEYYKTELNEFLAPMFGELLELDYDISKIDALQEDENKRWDRLNKAKFLTKNEKRVAVGYDDRDDGDEYDDGAAIDDGEENSGDSDEKSFQLADQEAKEIYYNAVETKRNDFVPSVNKQVVKRFDAELKMLLDVMSKTAVLSGLMDNVDAALDEHVGQWTKLITAIGKAVGEPFGLDSFNEIMKNAPKGYNRPSEMKGPEFFIEDELDYYIRSRSGEKIANDINRTTKTQIRVQLAEGVSAGESIPKLSKRLSELYADNMTKSRATKIARTEVIRASNAGSQAGAMATGLALMKEWISTADTRTRDAHQDSAHISDVKLDEDFMVDGEPLAFPGDAKGSPGNVINCRCTHAFYPV
ncbi:MAG: phage portal protein [Deltaproteobacteria bacterium]|nr:MAG: phage portal protein [Deltaproteobacteria bacterium]